jgi:hypothetical protein
VSGRTSAKNARWRWERVWDLHENLGFTVTEIAESMRLHSSTVSYYLRKGEPPLFRRRKKGKKGKKAKRLADYRAAVVREKSARGGQTVDYRAGVVSAKSPARRPAKRTGDDRTVVPFERRRRASR